MEIKIGLKEEALNEVTEGLSDFLADTYALYLKTQNFHWNVVGAHFFSLHIFFEKQYEDLAEAVDEVAERIRSLGAQVDGTFSAFQKRTVILDAPPTHTAKQMIEDLLKSHEDLICRSRPLIHRSQKLLDDVTSDLVIKRFAFHEKAAWMLRSHLENLKS